MEVCSKTVLGNVEIAFLSNNETHMKNVNNCDEVDDKIEHESLDMDIETVNELVHKKPVEKTIQTGTPAKKIKIKRSRGDKRKFPDKIEFCNKIKRNKKEEKWVPSRESSSGKETIEGPRESDCLELEVTPKAKTDHGIDVENDSDVENREVQVQKEKCKQMSSRKSKALTNACRDTLEVLLKFGLETLDSMDKSLKLLNSHNCFSHRLISIDTLMELISAAIDLIALGMNPSKNPEEMSLEKEASLSRIIAKLAVEICKTPKVPKARQNILSASVSPKTKQNSLEEVSIVSVPKEEAKEDEAGQSTDQEEKMEQCEVMLDTSKKDGTQTVTKSGNNFCITNYFKKVKKAVEDKNTNERFSSFTTKTDMFIAPKLGGELTGLRRQKFEEQLNSQSCEVNYLLEHGCKLSNKEGMKSEEREEIGGTKSDAPQEPPCEIIDLEDEEVKMSDDGFRNDATLKTGDERGQPMRKKIVPIRIDLPKIQPTLTVNRTKAKLFQFHDNRRPPYWGTWRRKSTDVRPKRPFGKDKMFNYEVDSDDEWEEEEEPGESLHGSDDEKEPEEDYEVDNDFFVPHGYLSDDENPEQENMSPKTKLKVMEEQLSSELSQKTRKMAPIVFGTFWSHKGLPPEGNLFKDLQLERLQISLWVSTPIQIEEEEEKKPETSTESGELSTQMRKSRRSTFPDEEIPHLIKMIHGSPQNSEILAKKFLLYWNNEKVQDSKRPSLTKSCILKKIKELAARQTNQEKGRMCWMVPKETREEFGAGAEVEESTKKPKKCYIWKFIKKKEKSAVVESSSDTQEPEVVIFES